MTRIIAGVARGRRLAVPPGTGTRPTSDRAREGLFGTLTAMTGTLAGARVLDLYAGSGAIGIEALSRGAEHVLFVESGPAVAQLIRANLAATGVAGGEVVTGTVARVLARGQPAAPGFGIAVADPPYALPDGDVEAMLTALAAGGWLAPGAVVAVERATRSGELRWPPGYVADRSRRYGEGTFWYGLAAGV